MQFKAIWVRLIIVLPFFLNNYTYSQSLDINNVQLDSFKRKMDFNKLYLVFAGPYPSSPSSSFGHIFILFEPKVQKPLLLWSALNFGVNIDSISSIEMFTKGIFGGLFGEYKIISFYEKLREYTFVESRPLWLFPLSLSNDQKSIFIKNLLTQMDIKYKYRFHDKNCASKLSLLLGKALDHKLKNNLYTAPHDVLVEFKDYLEDPFYIESTERALNNFLISKEKNLNSLAVQLQILEWKYNKRKRPLSVKEQNKIKKLRVLVANSKQKKESLFIKSPLEFHMHSPFKLSIGSELQNKTNYIYNFGFRLALHEFEDNSSVFPNYDFFICS